MALARSRRSTAEGAFLGSCQKCPTVKYSKKLTKEEDLYTCDKMSLLPEVISDSLDWSARTTMSTSFKF